MNIRPILSAIGRNRAGAILIALQVALTLAIVCNALFIIGQRLSHMHRQSGVTNADLFTFGNVWIKPDEDFAARQAEDLIALRTLPSVADAYAADSLPLSNSGRTTPISVKPSDTRSNLNTAIYSGDAHTLPTLGLNLVAGRNFTADEVITQSDYASSRPGSVILTRALAAKLFPSADALGKSVYVGDTVAPSTVVGIVAEMAVPWTNGWGDHMWGNSTVWPVHPTSSHYRYVVRAKPGQMESAIKDSEARLFELSRNRVIEQTRSMAELERGAYRSDRGMAIMMAVFCSALLMVTAAGIVGLASFWVGQRHRQIGIRRALGARRADILNYFLLENLMITVTGVGVGSAIAIGFNLWLVAHYAMTRLSLPFLMLGAVVLVALGQAAVLWPAVRAARVPPLVATRAA